MSQLDVIYRMDRREGRKGAQRLRPGGLLPKFSQLALDLFFDRLIPRRGNNVGGKYDGFGTGLSRCGLGDRGQRGDAGDKEENFCFHVGGFAISTTRNACAKLQAFA